MKGDSLRMPLNAGLLLLTVFFGLLAFEYLLSPLGGLNYVGVPGAYAVLAVYAAISALSLRGLKWGFFAILALMPLLVGLMPGGTVVIAPALEASVSFFLSLWFARMLIGGGKPAKVGLMGSLMLLFLAASAVSLAMVLVKSGSSLGLDSLPDMYLIFTFRQGTQGFPWMAASVFVESFLLYAFAVTNIGKRDLPHAGYALLASLCIASAAAAYGWTHFDMSYAYTGINRTSSLYSNPNSLGTALIMTIPLALSFGLFGKSRASLLLALLGLFALYFSHSRGAALGLAAALTFLWAYWKRKWTVSHLGALTAAALAAMLVGACVASYFLASLEPVELARITNGRYYIWMAGINMILSHPIAGIGIGGFYNGLGGYYPHYILPWATRNQAHSMFIQLTAEQGLIGFIPYAAILAYLGLFAAKGFRRMDYISAGLCACIIAALTHSLLDYTLREVPLSMMFWAEVGLLIVSLQPDD